MALLNSRYAAKLSMFVRTNFERLFPKCFRIFFRSVGLINQNKPLWFLSIRIVMLANKIDHGASVVDIDEEW